MAVVVTGANGFIGSHVVRMLVEEGRTVRAFVQRGQPVDALAGLDVEIVEGDLLDPSYPPGLFDNVEVLYHLAAIYALWLRDPSLMYRVNVEATVRLMEEVMRHDSLEKVVFTSSIAAVGARPDQELADESVLFNAWGSANDYVWSKYLSELEVQRLVLQRDLPATIVNPGFPFGVGDARPTPTGKMLVDYLNGTTPGVMAGGVSVVDVEDVARGHLLAEENGIIGERYILVGHNCTYKELMQRASQVAGVKRPSVVVSARAMMPLARMLTWVSNTFTHRPPLVTPDTVRYTNQHLFFANTKARTELGLTITPLETSLARAIRWFAQHGYIRRKLNLSETEQEAGWATP